MSLTVDVWQLLGVAGTFMSAYVAILLFCGKLLVGQFQSRLDEKFYAQEEIRTASQKHWDTKFTALEVAAANEAKEWQRIEREIMVLKTELPTNYVRRDDYIRNQTVIEAKIDGLAMRIENAILKGERNG